MKSTNALDWACDLEKSGMPNEQAVAVAQVFHESHETLMENMREMFAEQAGEIRSKHRWVIGLIIGVNSLMIGVIGLMFGAVLQILSQTS